MVRCELNSVALWILVGFAIVAACGSGICAAQEQAQPHRPSFTVDKEKGIFDHGERIAEFQKRYFDEGKPVLSYVVLQPGKGPNLDELQCHWLNWNPPNKRKNFTMDAAGQGTDRLVVRFRSEDEQDRFVDEREVVITYDPAINSYVYDSTAKFIVQEGQTFRDAYVEYTDPHWIHVGLPGPSVPIEGDPPIWPIFGHRGKWMPLYQFFVYEAADGNVYKVHLNHRHGALTHNSLPLKEGAIYAAVYNPAYGNVAFQLLGDTGPRTDTEICSWGYDIHMRIPLSKPLEGGDVVTARFRTFQLPDDQALDLMMRARPRPLPPQDVLNYLRPVYHLHSTFDQTTDPYKTGGDVDPVHWEVFRDGRNLGLWNFMSQTGPVWSTSMGRTDRYCIGSVHPEPDHSGWNVVTGMSFWTGVATPEDKVYKVSVFVKMKDVEGKGAFISTEQWGQKIEGEPMTGSCDWTEVSMLSQPGWGNIGNSTIRLHLDGKGEVWWDDVRVELVDAPPAEKE